MQASGQGGSPSEFYQTLKIMNWGLTHSIIKIELSPLRAGATGLINNGTDLHQVQDFYLAVYQLFRVQSQTRQR